MSLTLPSREWLEQFASHEIDPVIDYAMLVADVAFELNHDEFFEELSIWIDVAMDVVCDKILEEEDGNPAHNS